MSIHPLASVSPEAELGIGVTVAAFASIEAGVRLGDYCTVANGAVIKSGTRLGCHNEICEHAVLGGRPQHVAQPSDVGTLLVGDP